MARVSQEIPRIIDSDEEDEEEEKEESSDEYIEEPEEKDTQEDVGDTVSSHSCWGTLLSLCGESPKRGGRGRGGGIAMLALGGVLDPRAAWVQEWNRIFLLVCVTGLFVDPLFFYALSISKAYLCLFIDGWFAITVSALRCMTDVLHVWNMWLQLKMAKHSYMVARERGNNNNSDESIGSIKSSSSARLVALKYLKARKGFFFDLFVILPLPQIVLWVVIPYLLRRGETNAVMTVFLFMFLFQYLPKIYHSVCLLRRMQKFSGYVFGTVWWGFALNIIVYFVASHVVGACWYLLGIQRATKCLREQCSQMSGCTSKLLAAEPPIFYGADTQINDHARLLWASYTPPRSTCLDNYNNYEYGAYKWVVYLVTNNNRFEKILMPMFWGLMTLSTFGNLESTAEWLESFFIIIVLTSGLLLVTMLIGNIKVIFSLLKIIENNYFFVKPFA